MSGKAVNAPNTQLITKENKKSNTKRDCISTPKDYVTSQASKRKSDSHMPTYLSNSQNTLNDNFKSVEHTDAHEVDRSAR